MGRYEVAEPFGVVVPADPRIPYDVFTMRAESPEVPDGALVRVRIAQFPTRRSAATGFVEEVLADTSDAPGAGHRPHRRPPQAGDGVLGGGSG